MGMNPRLTFPKPACAGFGERTTSTPSGQPQVVALCLLCAVSPRTERSTVSCLPLRRASAWCPACCWPCCSSRRASCTFCIRDGTPKLSRRFFPIRLRLSTSAGQASFWAGAASLSSGCAAGQVSGLIALLIAVFPANLYMLYKEWHTHGLTPFTLVLILRLPLQFLLIWWVSRATLTQDGKS